MNMALYQNFRKGLNSKPQLVDYPSMLPLDKVHDWYISLFQYNDKHKETLSEKGTLSGIKDTTTDRLYFDFDNKDDVQLAIDDSVKLVHRLLDKGADQDSIGVYFTGSKGISIEFHLDRRISPEEFRAAVFNLAGDLPTFDKVVNDPNRIVRVPNTKHQSSGLYKIPLRLEELDTLTPDEIKHLAKDTRRSVVFNKQPISLPLDIFKSKEQSPVITPVNREFDLEDLPPRPKYLDDARWALVNGYFVEGQRSNALLCLASTYRSMGYPQEITYRMLKGVAQIQSERTKTERYPDAELYNNIILQVYGPQWRGGIFSSKDPNSWLYHYCQEMGIKNEDDETRPIKIHEIGDGFLDYIDNFENNRIYFGIDSLDDALPLCGGSVVGIIGAAGSGKTSVALNLLANTSRNGALSVFASLDMSRNRLFEKILYRQYNKSREDTFAHYKQQKEDMKLNVQEDFGNVYVFDRSSPTVESIREYLNKVEQDTGEKIKLLVVDYFERVSSDVTDDTAASKRVASEFQDIANDFPHLCVVVCYQPNKFSLSGGPDTPILSYTAIKGSSFIYQSCRQIVSLWRPFFNPKVQSKDKYMEMAILKNDLGELDTFKFGWDGKRGIVFELDDLQLRELNSMLKEKENKNSENLPDGWK